MQGSWNDYDLNSETQRTQKMFQEAQQVIVCSNNTTLSITITFSLDISDSWEIGKNQTVSQFYVILSTSFQK